MLTDILKNRLFVGALAFFVLCVGGSLLYMHHDTQKGAEYEKETEDRVRQWNAKQNEQPTAKAPVVEQPAEVGHVHADGTWYAEADTNAEDTTALRNDESLSPVPWSNPLMPEEIPEHLKMPLEWINWDYQALSEEENPTAYSTLENHIKTLTTAVIENYNPKRPIEEVWPAFIKDEKLYHANSEHSQKYPIPVIGGFRADWWYQEIWNYPEIYELIFSEGGLRGQWFDVYRVEMGDQDPNWNLFHLHDGREFRIKQDKNYTFHIGYDEEIEKYTGSYSYGVSNPNTAEMIHVYPETMSATELEELQGWNYNFNPYTNQPISK